MLATQKGKKSAKAKKEKEKRKLYSQKKKGGKRNKATKQFNVSKKNIFVANTNKEGRLTSIPKKQQTKKN